MNWTVIAWILLVSSASLVAYTFVGYPLLTFVLAAVARRRVAKQPIEPKVAFIVSAYNEEAFIGKKIEDTLGLEYPAGKLKIIVASDGSTDRTDDITRSFEGRGVQLVRTEGRLGKTASLHNAVLAASDCEIVICSDATSVYSPGSVRELVANFGDPGVDGVCGRVAYEYNDSLVARGFRLYQQFTVRQRMNESLFGHQTQLSGAIHAIRRESYVPCPNELSTEEWNSFQIARNGGRTVYEYNAVALEESRSRVSSEFRARVRMALQCFAFTKIAMRHGFDRNTLLYTFQNCSSKVLRWLMPFVLAAMLVSAAALSFVTPWMVPVAALMWLAALVALLSIVFPRQSSRIPGLPFLSFFTIVMSAFAVAWFKFLFGRHAASWEPERGG